MIDLAASAAATPWWHGALASAFGALITFVGVILTLTLTLRHQRNLADRAERTARVTKEREVIAQLLIDLHLWLSSVANWGVAYEAAKANWRQSSNVQERHEEYQKAATAFSAALAIARVTVQNPTARPALDALQRHRGVMTNLVTLAMLGKPEKAFLKHWHAIHEDSAKAYGNLEEAALNWDGTLDTPIVVAPPKLNDGQDLGNDKPRPD